MSKEKMERVNKHLLAGTTELDDIICLTQAVRKYVASMALPWSDRGMLPRDEVTSTTHHNQRKAVIAEEKKRQKLIAENHKTYVEYVLKTKGSHDPKGEVK
jgi:hypothetical protein